MKSLKGLLLAASVSWVFVTPALAGGIYDFTQAPVSYESQLYSLGFLFTTELSVTVTSLGYFDDYGDGFATAHTVGIFDDCGTLIASTMLSAGTGDTLDGSFRYQTIAPVTLVAGRTFMLAATTGGSADGFGYGIAGETLKGLTVDPSITISGDASRYNSQVDDTLQNPAVQFGYTLYAGPNFGISPAAAPVGAAVPESGSLILTLTGAALMVIRTVRGRKARLRE